MTNVDIYKICRVSLSDMVIDIINREARHEDTNELRTRSILLLALLKQIGRKFNEKIVDEDFINKTLTLSTELLIGYLREALPDLGEALIVIGNKYSYTNLPARSLTDISNLTPAIATTTRLGVVKIGDGVEIDIEGNVTVKKDDSILGKILTVRGTTYGSVLDNTEFTPQTKIVDVLEQMLNKVVRPTYILPSMSLTRTGGSNFIEVGTNAILTLTSSFISNDSGGLTSYFLKKNGAVIHNTFSVKTDVFSPITEGTKTYEATINYAATNSANYKLNNFNQPDGTLAITAGSLVRTTGVDCIYPYLFGKIKGNRPTSSSIDYNSLSKVVSPSSGNITINFNSENNDYLVFILPYSLKTLWEINQLNKGSIGGSISPSGNLFPAPELVMVTTSLWTKQCYVYVSNYKTALGGLLIK
jgi:hypothetical protein